MGDGGNVMQVLSPREGIFVEFIRDATSATMAYVSVEVFRKNDDSGGAGGSADEGGESPVRTPRRPCVKIGSGQHPCRAGKSGSEDETPQRRTSSQFGDHQRGTRVPHGRSVIKACMK